MFEIEVYVQLVIFAAMLLLALFSLVDALLFRHPDAFHATGKLSKPAWVLLLVLAVAIDVIVILPSLQVAIASGGSGGAGFGILGIVSLVAAGVYLADVRPALSEIGRR